jgi:hypothetical protein
MRAEKFALFVKKSRPPTGPEIQTAAKKNASVRPHAVGAPVHFGIFHPLGFGWRKGA